MKEFIDQLGRKIILPSIPARIISLVPSQTELLHDLGLQDEVAGITKFCIHPDEWFIHKPKIGGTKKIDVEKIHQLNPDLIIGNKEENEESQVEELMERYPVWVSDIKNLDHALTMIEQVATLVGKEKLGLNLKNKIEQQFTQLNSAFTTHHSKLKAAYLIWNDPLMAAGGDTFIHDMLTRCGLKNVFSERKRYPVISANDLAASSPDILLLSSEPYPFKEKHLREIAFVCPESKNLLVDGELFSWYGSRLLNAPDYFRSLVKQIHSRN